MELTLVDPVGYLDFVTLQAGAKIIVTYSQGIQKEVFFLGVPRVTLREETEWPEMVEAGGNILVGANSTTIGDVLADPPRSPSDVKPYADGTAAEKIVEVLDDLST
nr:UDP-N-acetylglucosamine 2-epimerase [Halorubrum sp. F4]